MTVEVHQHAPRNGTAATWNSRNPVLRDGEFGVEKDTGKLKIGDGSTQWTALPYINDLSFLQADLDGRYVTQAAGNATYRDAVNLAGFASAAQLDGTADAAAAITAALAVARAQDQGWGDDSIHWSSSGGSEILLPPGAVIRIDTPINATKPLVLRCAAPWGARLVNNTGTDWIINQTAQGIGSVLEIDGVVFDSGGIKVTGPYRGHIKVVNSLFIDTPSWMIDLGTDSGASGSTGVTNAHIEYVMGYKCANGIRQAVETAQLFEARHIRFYAMGGIALDLDTSDVRVDHIDFQGMLASSADPWVRLAHSNNCIGISLNNCRFGPERLAAGTFGADYDAARTCVQIGGAGGGLTASALRDNLYLGSDNGPVAGLVADSAIDLQAISFKGLLVDGAYVERSFGTSFVEETWWTATSSTPLGTAELRAFHAASAFKGQVFNQGGRAWRRFPPPQDPHITETNRIASFSSWSTSGSTLVNDVTDVPTGGTGWTLTKTGTTNGSISRNATTTKTGPVTLSFLARAGSLKAVRVGVTVGARVVNPQTESMHLNDHWTLYSVTVPSIAASTVVSYRIFAGANGDTSTGTVELAGPPVLVEAAYLGR